MLTLDDFIAANELYQRRYWLWSGLVKLFVFSALGYCVLMLGFAAFIEPVTWQTAAFWLKASLYVGLGMIVFMPLFSMLIMRLRAKQQFEQLAFGLPVEYEADANGIRGANELGTSTLGWDRFSDFVQDKRLLLLRRTRRVFLPLPKAQLSATELELILGWLREAGVKEG